MQWQGVQHHCPLYKCRFQHLEIWWRWFFVIVFAYAFEFSICICICLCLCICLYLCNCLCLCICWCFLLVRPVLLIIIWSNVSMATSLLGVLQKEWTRSPLELWWTANDNDDVFSNQPKGMIYMSDGINLDQKDHWSVLLGQFFSFWNYSIDFDKMIKILVWSVQK